MNRNLLGSVLAASIACGHAHDAVPSNAAPAQLQQPQNRAREKAEYDAAPLTAEEPAPIFSESIETFMLDHFVISTWVRDSVIDGNIENIRAPLNALAEYDYRSVALGGWMNDITQLQAVARLTAQAQTIEAAARGVAAIGRVCGECHHKMNASSVQPYRQDKRAPHSDSFEARMFRHAWAVERMWEGLTAPSDNAWAVGAAALSQAPGVAPSDTHALPPTVVQTLQAVRALGAKATLADSFEAREKVYGELLVTCAECHRGTPRP